MKNIPLTQGQVAVVDDEDYARLGAYKWHAQWNRCTRTFYARRTSSRKASGEPHSIRMHREILGAKKGQEVDHINHDTLDNRRKNLRICSRADNQHNSRRAANNTSGFKGVSWRKDINKWCARISLNNTTEYLGCYASATEAAAAYDAAALRLCGEFALINRGT